MAISNRDVRPLAIRLNEWSSIDPESSPNLAGISCAELHANPSVLEPALHVVELLKGLRIESKSWVGRVNLGPLSVTITPKLDGIQLGRLVRYTYGLRDLRLLDTVDIPSNIAGFEEILALQLKAEVRELVGRGLHRRYEPEKAWLSSPRGRIDMAALAQTRAIYHAALPCRFYPRLEDTAVNQALLAGLDIALRVTADLQLRRELQALKGILAESISVVPFDLTFRRRLARFSSRLTAHYGPALRLIEFLADGIGVALESEGLPIPVSGFLFDMNRFFQALISKFLREHLEGYDIKDEDALRGMMRYSQNPRHRQAPQPRPDFAVLSKGRVVALLDAKYRDLWEQDLPPEWLYQLAIYAMSGLAESKAVILYPTLNAQARESRIDIYDAVGGPWRAAVLMRPVYLKTLSDLVSGDELGLKDKQRFARRLVFGMAA